MSETKQQAGVSEAFALELDAILGPARPKQPNGTPLLLKLRTPHHELARLLAMGYKDVEISQMTGYSQSRICVLKTDPMFGELVVHYLSKRDEIVVDMTNRLQRLAVNAVEVIQERLDENADAFSVKELQAISEMSLDRVGYGKSSTLNVNSNRVRTLDEIKAAIQAGHQGRVTNREEPALSEAVDSSARLLAESEPISGSET